MTSNYAYTPSIWPSVFTLLLLIALVAYSCNRRSVPGATPFMVACLFAAAWAAASLMEVAAGDVQAKIFWFKFQRLFQIPLVTATTCFVLEYAWPGRWLTRRNLILLSIPCLLGLIIILTNNLHHLLWRGFEVDGKIFPIRGPINWTYLGYTLGLTILNLIIFIWLFVRSPQHRWPVVIMVAGMVAGRLLFVLQTAQIIQSELPPFMFEFLMYAIALFGFRILDPIPLARQTAIEQLPAGMLVLDPQGKIVSSNPAAQSILGSPAKRLRGRPIQDLLPACAGLTDDLQAVGNGQDEISLSKGPDTRYYQVEASALNDWRGLVVGRLLMLHDVTEQKRAQAQLLEQQRALAMLQEREQLARELHDSTGQVLGYAGFQLEVVHDRILDGQAALSAGKVEEVHTQLVEAGCHLTRLSNIVVEAHADLREYILNLRLAPSDQRPFFATLQHYLDGYSQNYGIQTELSARTGVEDEWMDAEAQMQLFRIIQEALSNARKHAEARSVQISFEKRDRLMSVTIKDNGHGFEPQAAMKKGDGHFGLHFMHERAEQIGGSLRVESTSGKGTCVIVELPMEGAAYD